MKSLQGSLEALDAIEKVKALELFEEDDEKLTEDTELDAENEFDNTENNTVSNTLSQEDYIKSLETDTNYEVEGGLEAYSNAPVTVRSCDSLKIGANDHIVLVVCHGKGELGLEARKLVYDRCGEYVTLPHGIAGLDLKVSTGIIMYEIAKQLNAGKSDGSTET